MSAPTTPVIIGFVVVCREKNSRGQPIDKPLSRRFTVKAAAEQFAELARKAGRDAFVRTVHGIDEFGL